MNPGVVISRAKDIAIIRPNFTKEVKEKKNSAMPIDTTLSISFPAGVQPQSIIALLYDHEAYIRTMCPQLLSC